MKQTLQERLREFAANKLIDDTISTLDLAESCLRKIATQKLQSEMHPDWRDGDYEAAYELMIRDARAALKAIKGVE